MGGFKDLRVGVTPGCGCRSRDFQSRSAASEEIRSTTEDISRIAGETAGAMTQPAQELKTIISDMQQN